MERKSLQVRNLCGRSETCATATSCCTGQRPALRQRHVAQVRDLRYSNVVLHRSEACATSLLDESVTAGTRLVKESLDTFLIAATQGVFQLTHIFPEAR